MHREVDHLIIGAGNTGMHLAKVLSSACNSKKAEQILVVDNDFSKVSMQLRPSQIRSCPFELIEKAQDASQWLESSKQTLSPFHAISSYFLKTLSQIKTDEHQRGARLTTLRSLGVSSVEGKARFIDRDLVAVNVCQTELVIKAKNIYLATGAAEHAPKIKGLEDSQFVFPSDLLNLKKVPRSVIVVGGSALGCSLAQSFAALGITTTLIEPGPRLLDSCFASSIRDKVKENLLDSNVIVNTSCRLQEAKDFPRASNFLVSTHETQETTVETTLEPGQLLTESGQGQMCWHQAQLLLFACTPRPNLSCFKQVDTSGIKARLGIPVNAVTGLCDLFNEGQDNSRKIYAFGSGAYPVPSKGFFHAAMHKVKTQGKAAIGEPIHEKDTLVAMRGSLMRSFEESLHNKKGHVAKKSVHSPRLFSLSKDFFLAPFLQSMSQKVLKTESHHCPLTLFIPTKPPLLQVTSQKFFTHRKSFSIKSRKEEDNFYTLILPADTETLHKLIVQGGEKEKVEHALFLKSGYVAQILCSKDKGEIWKITLMCPHAQEMACSLEQAISESVTLEAICNTNLASYAPTRLFEQAFAQFQWLKKQR